jgi:hypothetical protein
VSAVALYLNDATAIALERIVLYGEQGIVDRVYVLVHPDSNRTAEGNRQWLRQHFGVLKAAGVQPYGWFNPSGDVERDAGDLIGLLPELPGLAWLFDVEKESEGKSLSKLAVVARSLNPIPPVWCVGGGLAEQLAMDYRSMDGDEVELQCYNPSGSSLSGPTPAQGVAGLFQPVQLNAGALGFPVWWYRVRFAESFRWCLGLGMALDGFDDLFTLKDGHSKWGVPARFEPATGAVLVTSRQVIQRKSKRVNGQLYGFARYRRIRIALGVENMDQRALNWTTLAESARYPGCEQRRVSIYKGENAADETIRAAAAA